MMRIISVSPCKHFDCSNRNSFGYCKTTVCINEHYQQEQWGSPSTTNKSESVVKKQQTNADNHRRGGRNMKQCKICLDSDSCSFDWRDPDCEYMNCTEFKKPPPTNADRIRAKSDEELAEWMVGEQINGIYAFLKGLEDDDLLHDFIEVINSHGAEEIKKEKLEWLKQEANP